MKKIIVQLVTNRFGIVLVALNLCYFVSKNNDLVRQPFGKLFLCANFPAAISSLLSVEIVKFFLHNLSFPRELAYANFFFVFFCASQWLFIAWVAKALAAKVCRPKLS